MKFYIITFVLFILFVKGQSIKLIAYISQNGLHGEFTFTQHTATLIKIESSLETTLQYPDQVWSWGINELPVDYTNVNSKERCSDAHLGKSLENFDDNLGYLTLPGNESSVWHSQYSLTGDKGFWGKSLLLTNPDNGFRICATITTEDTNVDHIAEARFYAPIGGTIYFRWLVAKESDHRDTLIYTNLYHTQNSSTKSEFKRFTSHAWKIYVTDIFEKNDERPENNCNILQLVFNPQNAESGQSIGDIDSRLGKINVAAKQNVENRELFRDESLVLLPSDLTGPQRQLYIVIFDPLHANNFLACAKIRHIRPRMTRANFNEAGIKGKVTIFQRTRFEPSWLNFTIASSSNEPRDNAQFAQDVAGFKIYHLPSDPLFANRTDHCRTCGVMYNPSDIDETKLPPPGYGTQDQYPVGDLTGKLQNRNKKYAHDQFLPESSLELNGIYWDIFLPIEGKYSAVHRGVVIHRYNRSDTTNITQSIWTCGTLSIYDRRTLFQTAMLTLEVLFRYPIVGRVLFRQPRDEPWTDTTILVEYLIHADGSTQNTSTDHRWAIHAEGIGKDFYNWTGRCLSTRDVYNPHKVSLKVANDQRQCDLENIYKCRLGDLTNRLGTITIAGSKLERNVSRVIFTVGNLPLSGHNKIFGKSLVIYDDFGPVARGERLACSNIGGYNWRKAVARDWHANGVPLTVKGKIEIFQQSEYEITNVEVHVKGLIENSGYHVHVAPVMGELEFPCEGTAVYDHWNPRRVNPKQSPAPSVGTSDQYELGDLSGKFGTLDGYNEYNADYNDTIMPLFGYETILGRSIVIHKRDKNLRWSCSTLERGYSPNEAREIRAIASFHHPAGYAYGYMRFTQLIHNDGSKSDTIIEVNLRHPGVNDRNLTRNHNWNIFVNPVGVDATVAQTATRCVAGGYIWNPFYTQLADPLNTDLYRKECGPDNPLRCYVGDVSARVGTIDMGDKRKVMSDSNFPLEGVETALGRSIVIFGPNFSSERYACANIEPDHYIVKYINLQKPPKFVVAQFLEDVRHVMGLSEWMLSIDSRKTKTLHNGACIQMIVNFKGARAHQIELDFSRLISTGRLNEPSVSVPGYVNQKRKKTLSYRTCGVRDPNEKQSRVKQTNSAAGLVVSQLVVTYFIAMLIMNI